MDWRLLGYAVEEPWKERSKNQQDKFNKKVVADASIFLTRTFAPQMQTEIRNMIPRHQREDVTKGLLNRILKQSGIKDQ